MALRDARFQLDEEISLGGKPTKVAGLAQFEEASGKLVTRYLLADDAGAPVLLEEEAGSFAMLRVFLPSAQPEAPAGAGALIVSGEKYTLKRVRQLKLVGTAGRAPLSGPKGGLLVSGQFDGRMGLLVREMAPGSQAQSFYFLKPMEPGEVLSAAELEALHDIERGAAEQNAEAEDGAGEGRTLRRIQLALAWSVVLVVTLALAYSCTR